jgi:hypothetical protein
VSPRYRRRGRPEDRRAAPATRVTGVERARELGFGPETGSIPAGAHYG